MAGRGGRRPNTGGKRPGAGRKLEPSALKLREWYRAVLWRDREKHYRIAVERAKKGDTAFLSRLYDKVLPTPTEIDLNVHSIPSDFTFRCELSTRSGSPSAAPMAVSEGGHRVSRD